jgi:hypothetical protein
MYNFFFRRYIYNLIISIVDGFCGEDSKKEGEREREKVIKKETMKLETFSDTCAASAFEWKIEC